MSVSDVTPYNSSTADGATNTFAYGFLIYDEAHIEVRVDGGVKVLTTDYTVTGVGNSSGGTIVFNSGKWPAAGALVERERVVPYARATDFTLDYRGNVVDKDNDLLVMMMQQVRFLASLGLRLPTSASGVSAELPSPVALRFLCWNAAANAMVNMDIAGQGLLAVSDFMKVILATDGAPLYRKNFIINGNFDVWQGGTSWSSAPNGQYVADVYSYYKGGTMVHNLVQSGSTPAQAQSGVKSNFSLKALVATAQGALGATDRAFVETRIEGYLLQYLEGQTITLSFWVKSSKTGTYCVGFRNASVDRAYVVEYTINAADTWEKKVLTIPMNYSGGTWDYTTSTALRITWTLAAGSSYQTTAGAWQNGYYIATSNQVNGVDSIGNDFFLAQVQLEIGDVATAFEWQGYGDVLRQVQRYYEVSGDPGGHRCTFSGNVSSGSDYIGSVDFAVPKRAAPTVTLSNQSVLSFPATVGTVSSSTSGFSETRTANASGAARFVSTWVADARL